MIDILWRTLNDFEKERVLIHDYPDKQVLVLTNVTYRISYAKYIDIHSEKLLDYEEKVIKFAFIE